MDCVVCHTPILLEPDMAVCQPCRLSASDLDPIGMFRPKDDK